MGRRRPRKRTKAGRKVYYPRFSLSTAKEVAKQAGQMRAEDAQRARYFSPANAAARLKRENHYQDAIIKTFGMNRGGDNKPREECLDKLSQFVKIDQMDRHIVVHQGLDRVRILFNNKQETKYWFVERNLLTDDLYRSIDYGSREVAFILHDSDRVNFVR